MGKWELTFHDLLNYFIPGAILLTLLSLPIMKQFNITLDDTNVNVFLFLIVSYVVGHLLDPAFKKCAEIARKEKKGKFITLLVGPSEHDWRTFYISGTSTDTGVPGLVNGEKLAMAINDVVGSKNTISELSLHSDTFYTCWRLLEAELPDGLRYHHRTMAFYNFSSSMTFSLLLSSPAVGWYSYQLSAQYFSANSYLFHALFTVSAFIVALLFARVFFREYAKYRKEWVQNVYRLFWVWYNVRYKNTEKNKEKINFDELTQYKLLLID